MQDKEKDKAKVDSREPESVGLETAAPLVPADLTSLRLDESMEEAMQVERPITTIPVRKPGNEAFVRTHPDPVYAFETMSIEFGEDREMYLVDRPLWEELVGEVLCVPRVFVPTITRQGILFLWPIRLPGPEGRTNSWNQSALGHVARARENWVRLRSNQELKAYEIVIARAELGDPVWPDLDLAGMLAIAFEDRFVDSAGHPVLRRLRGEV